MVMTQIVTVTTVVIVIGVVATIRPTVMAVMKVETPIILI